MLKYFKQAFIMLLTALASEVIDWVVLNAKTGVKSAKASQCERLLLFLDQSGLWFDLDLPPIGVIMMLPSIPFHLATSA